MNLVESILRGTKLVFIGAHPDDEGLIAPLIAFAGHHSRVQVECVTLGQSGWNLSDSVNERTLGQLRTDELFRACREWGASARVLGYINGTSTAHPSGFAISEDEGAAHARWKAHGEFTQEPDGVLQRWSQQNGNLSDVLRACILANPGCIVVTFEPSQGLTGHPEHRALAAAVTRLFFPTGAVACGELDATLYWMLHPKQCRPTDESVAADFLSVKDSRNYVEIAERVLSIYETQFGKMRTKSSEKYISDFRDTFVNMAFRRVTNEDANRFDRDFQNSGKK